MVLAHTKSPHPVLEFRIYYAYLQILYILFYFLASEDDTHKSVTKIQEQIKLIQEQINTCSIDLPLHKEDKRNKI